MNAARTPWVMTPRPCPGAALRLFCFPFAGAGASSYFQWAAGLSSLPVEVAAIQLPGRENRLGERPFADLPALVAAMADGLAPLLDRPYCFFGHSMGALLAFETARVLRARGAAAPLRLFVSGAHPPQVPRTDPPLHHLSDDLFVQEVAARYGGIPPAVLEHRELLETILPALRADMTIIDTYAFIDDAPLPSPISAFAGRDDGHIQPPLLRRWQECTSGEFSMTLFDGGHFYLQQHRAALLDVLGRQLTVLADAGAGIVDRRAAVR